MTTAPTLDESLPSLKVLNPLDSNCNVKRDDAICVSQLRNGAAAEKLDREILTANPDVKIVLPLSFHVFGDEELFFSNTFKQFFNTRAGDHMAGQLDNISFASPPSPLVSQFRELDPGILCNGDQRLTNCSGICKCTHLIQIPLNSTVELIVLDRDNTAGINHPLHLHGMSFYVLGNGKLPQGHNMTIKEIVEMDRKTRKSGFPPGKDTITIPTGGYVILRFRATNPGFWFFHCHFLFHILTGMSAVFQVGSLSDFPPVPHNFPRCGNFL
ncbi:hypothetical protein RI129_012400 [Pyrocoelia pectoralis]|uniref:Plastocyanin-like domain-containing protein n=1 Tax=Pyrocoelia pectoralis TaxID=417401 RepID=A0AAN7Z5V8_9COLE